MISYRKRTYLNFMAVCDIAMLHLEKFCLLKDFCCNWGLNMWCMFSNFLFFIFYLGWCDDIWKNIPTWITHRCWFFFCYRYNPSLSSRQLFHDIQLDQCLRSSSFKFEEGALFDSSNFLDVDWLSSSGNSCEEETYDR